MTPDNVESNENFLELSLFRSDLRLRKGHLRDILVHILLLTGGQGCVGHFRLYLAAGSGTEDLLAGD